MGIGMQTTMAYLETNALALAVLLLVFFNIRQQSKNYFTEQKLFLLLLATNSAILVLDSFMWVLDGMPGRGVRILYLAVTAAYYFANPFICMLWTFYVDYQINRDEKRMKTLTYYMPIPAAVNAVLAVMSVFGGYMFSIDESNVYHRGPLFFVMVGISYVYLIHTFMYTLWNREKMNKRQIAPILLFPLPPFIGSVVQSIYYGVSLIWVCMTLSLLIVFFSIQNAQLYTDYLTGLYNRRQLDHYVREKSKKEKALAGIMMDIDCFKRINDVFGHEAGDLALEQTAKILKDTFRRDDFIARFGGDEFVVVLKIENSSDLIGAIGRLSENIAKFNAQKIFPFGISLSMGYDYFDYKPDVTIQEFFRHIDNLMYEDKISKKRDLRESVFPIQM